MATSFEPVGACAERKAERRAELGLKPFFSYYGGKWRDARRNYPVPVHDLIVEPFAGSAGYSLRHYHARKVVLCEIDPIVFGVWNFLIRSSEKDIRRLPDFPPHGGSIDDLTGICEEARWLIGFWLNRATTSPRKTPSRWMRDGIRPGSFWGERVRATIASQVKFISDWRIYNCTYEDLPLARKQKATWFIDPPYEYAGQHYRFGSRQVDYGSLAAWCLARPGQVIVCENEGADWLPFRTLATVKTARRRRSDEVVWTNGDGDKYKNPTARHRP